MIFILLKLNFFHW